MAQWLSWLERRPVTAEVESSSLFWVVMWDLSSAGRASALQAEGHRFEPCRSHYVDGFPSGQRGQTVNLLATPSKVRILLHPLAEWLDLILADVAQLAEQLICNQQVIGSSPIIGLHQTVNLNDVCWKTVKLHLGGFPSGQRGQTVNLLQFASVVRIHLRPLHI